MKDAFVLDIIIDDSILDPGFDLERGQHFAASVHGSNWLCKMCIPVLHSRLNKQQ